MNIDGTNTLACLKPISESVTGGKIKIYPLPHLRTNHRLPSCSALHSSVCLLTSINSKR